MSQRPVSLGAAIAMGLLVVACSGDGSATGRLAPDPTTTTTAPPDTTAGEGDTSSGNRNGLLLAVSALAIGLAIALGASLRNQPGPGPDPKPDPYPPRFDPVPRPRPEPAPRPGADRFPPTIGEAQPSADVERLLQHSATAPSDVMVHAGRTAPVSGHSLVLRAATLRGVASCLEEKERQDAYSFVSLEQHLILAVADGVGSLPDSGIAARVASRNACVRLEELLGSSAEFDDDAMERVFESSAWDIVLAARRHSGDSQLSPQQALESMATTLVVGVIERRARGNSNLTVARVGDSSAWLLRGREARPLWDDAEDESVLDTKTAALPGFGVEGVEIVRHAIVPNDVLVLASDGFANAWGSGSGDVADYFTSEWADPPDPIVFAGHVGYRRRSFDDDRTVIAVWVK